MPASGRGGSLRTFPGSSARTAFVGLALLHFAKHAFALHFLFQDAECLVDVVVANENLQGMSFSWFDVNDDVVAFICLATTDGRNLPGPGRSASAAADPGRRVSLRTARACSVLCRRHPPRSSPAWRGAALPAPSGGCATASFCNLRYERRSSVHLLRSCRAHVEFDRLLCHSVLRSPDCACQWQASGSEVVLMVGRRVRCWRTVLQLTAKVEVNRSIWP